MTDDDVPDHQVLYVDPDWLDDPDAYEGPEVDTDDQPDFPSGIHAVAASTDMRVIVWRTDDMAEVWSAGSDAAWGNPPEPHRSEDGRPSGLFTSVTFSGDGRRVAAVGGSPWVPEPVEAPAERLVVAEAATGEIVFAATIPIRGAALLDHAGTTVTHLGANDDILVRDLPSGMESAELLAAAFTPDGRALVTADSETRVVAWVLDGRAER
ncbi:hypothetical protein [Spirillospora sp. NPDC048824]|uniref:hypothetical protein n=1 Tax=Spirillospora sp. NPDC048824 TaxID=3364526 RepID=UPI003724B03F